MLSNLPLGCLDSDIPGNTPIDKVVDKAISDKECIACMWRYQKEGLCNRCENKSEFERLFSLSEIAENIRAEADAREDGHSDD